MTKLNCEGVDLINSYFTHVYFNSKINFKYFCRFEKNRIFYELKILFQSLLQLCQMSNHINYFCFAKQLFMNFRYFSVNLRNNTHRWPTEMLYVAQPDIFFQRDLNFTEFNSSELSENLTFPKLN